MEINYTIYQITNNINGMIYVGSHKSFKLIDNYYGSGKIIKKEIKRLGKENFTKTIISYHDSNEEMLLAEKNIVNREFVERIDTYNLIIAGGYNTIDTILVVNESGKNFRVTKDDPDYISGKLVTPNKGKIMAKDIDGNNYRIYKNDPRFLSGELFPAFKNKTLVFNEYGDKIWIDINDKKFIEGTYKHITKGKKVSNNTKLKLSNNRKLNNVAKGSNNPNYGKCFISKLDEIKTINKFELNKWLLEGWIKMDNK